MSGLDAFLFTVVAALATWQMLEIWHHGSLFDRTRAWVEAHEEGFFVELLMCMFCLSNWVGVLSVIAVLSLAFRPDNFEWHHLSAIPVLGFAAARLANLFNDLGRTFCRTPNRAMPEVDDLENMGMESDDEPTEPGDTGNTD